MKKLFLRTSSICHVRQFRIAKLFLTVVCFLSVIGGIQGQTMMLGTTVGGGSGYTYTNYTMTNNGAFCQKRVQENYSTSTGSRGWEFNADSYYNTWRASYNYQQISSYNNEIFPSSSTASAYWRNSSGGSTAAMLSTTSGNYYTFNITYEGAGPSYQNQEMEILETTYNPTVISSVSQSAVSSSVYPNCSVTVTATLASTPNSGEYFYIRYTTNAFSTTTAALMSVSGTSATATIPAQAAGTTVSYYIFSSNTNSLTLTGKGSDYYDCATLNFINNSGSNYSYTVLSAPTAPTVSIAASPSGAVCTGTPVGFTATPSNAGSSPTYTFYVNGTSVQTGSSNSYSYMPVNSDAVTCKVTNNTTCTTSVSSNSITESVNALPAISSTSQPTVCAGSVGVIYLTGLANSVSYTVNYNYSGSGTQSATFTSNASGNTGNFNTYQALQFSDNGNTFTITSITNNATSCVNNSPSNNTVTLSVSASVTPAVSLGASATTICAGTSVLFTATPTSGSGLSPTYNFQVNGSSVQNSSSSTYSTTSLTNGQVVNCIMTSSSTCASPTTGTSGNITMTVNTASVAPTGISGTTTVCLGNGTALTATGGTLGTGATYQWGTGSTIGTSPVSGATSVTYSVTPTSNTTYWVSVTGTSPCGSPSGGATQLVTLTGNTWLGGTSTDWNVAANWCNGTVPTSSTNVIIPSGTTYSPIIGVSGANATCNTLTINSGATLTMQSSYTLTIAASGSLTNNGTFTAGTGTVVTAGAATINGSNAITFNNLTITTGTVTLTTVPTINGTFLINGGNVSSGPIYGPASTLNYAPGGTYNRGVEWNQNSTTTGTSGAPNNVTLSNSTTLNYPPSGATPPSLAMAGNLTINSGSALYMDYGSPASSNPLTVKGNVNLIGSLSLGNQAGGDIYVGGNWAFTVGGTFNTNYRAVFFNGSSQQTISRSAAGTLNFDYIVNQNTSGGIKLSSSTNLNINAHNGGNGLTMSSSATPIDLNGDTIFLTASQSISTTGSNTIMSSSGTGVLDVSLNTTCSMTGSGTMTFGPGITILLLGGTSGSMNFGSGISTIVNGSLQLNNGSFVTGNAPTYGTGSNLIYNTGGAYSRNVEFGTTSGAGYPYNVIVQNGTFLDLSGTNALTQNIGIANNLTISGGSSGVGLNNSAYSLAVGGNVSIGSGTNGLYLSTVSGGDIYVGGNWTNSGGNFGAYSRAVFFTGSKVDTVTTLSTDTFAYLFVQKTSSANSVLLATNATVTDVLNLTTGILNTGNDTITVKSTASTAISSYSASSYVNGFLRRYVASSTSYDFPVGSSSNYELANITFSAGLTGTSYLTASFNAGAPTSPSPSTCIINGSPMSGVLNAGYWSIHPDVQPTAGTYTSTLNLIGASNLPSSYAGYTSGGAMMTITPAMQIGLIKRANSTSSWLGCGVTTYGQSGTNQNLGNTTTVGGSISGSVVTVSRSSVPSFSDFGIGVEANPTYALPVALIYFTAEPSGNNTLLNWATASETNNAYFAVERSTDGQNFQQIGQVAGHGNSVVTINYQYTDEDITSLGVAVLYYRLKQVDVDGNATYTSIASVDMASTNPVFHILATYPNPFTDHLSVSFFAPQSGAIRMSLYDVQGQLVRDENINAETGINVFTISDDGRLASGLYMMNITVGNQNYSIKLVKGE